MNDVSRAKQLGFGEYLLAVLAALAFVLAPMQVWAQDEGESKDEESQEEQTEEPADAPGGPTPKLFVLPVQPVSDGVSSIIPERIGELLRDQVQSDRRVELLPTYETLSKQMSAGGGSANAAITKANDLYTSGIGLLTAGEDKKAAESFQSSVDIMEENLGDVTNFNILTDAYKNLALAYFNAGFDFDARKKMKVYAHLKPESTLDPEKFPKELRDIFDEETAKVKKAGPGKLEIKAPEGAQVTIDGDLKGEAPMTVTDVGFGYHYLVVRNAAGNVWAEQIRVRGRGKQQEFEVDLGSGGAKADSGQGQQLPAFYTDLLASIRTGTFGDDLQPYLNELSTRSGTDYVGWVAMVRDGMEYVAVPFVWRASDGMLVRGSDVRFNIELSNLMVGVSTLSENLVDDVVAMPKDRAVTTVELGQPDPATEQEAGEEGGAVASSEQTEQGGEELPMPESSDGSESTEMQPPPEVKPSDKGANTWTYVGIGGGVLAVGGIIAGSVFLLTQDSPNQSGDFRTRVRW
ncbi:MAG: PEGA domain-containing protein [Myxococcota bacterium]